MKDSQQPTTTSETTHRAGNPNAGRTRPARGNGTVRFLSLLAERNRLETYLDMIHVMVVAIDTRGIIQLVNEPACRLLGYSREELLGRDWFETCLPAAERPNVRKVFNEVISGKVALHERHENRVLCRDGTTRLLDWHNTLLFDDNGDVAGSLSSGRDITEERRLHEALAAAAREWGATFEALPDGICVLGADQTLRRCNATMHRWFPDVAPSDHPRTRCYRVVHHTDGPVPECPFVRMRSSLKRESSEMYVDGRWFEVTVDPIFDALGALDGAVHFMRDITERKKAEEERSQLESQFLQAQKMEAVGRLAGGIAHDFNNMLTVILGYAESTLANDKLPPDIREDIVEIRKAAGRSAELTRRLLSFSKHQIISPKVLDLHRLAQDLRGMMQRILGETVELTILSDEDLWPVYVDPVQMDQVVTNLLVNAKDAMPQGGRIVLETRNVVLGSDYAARKLDCHAGDYVLLAVSDTGTGMDSKTLSHVFEPFFTTKDPAKGTGLGLSTVYGIARHHEGTVHIYSEPGVGTTVKVYLPRHVTGEQSRKARTSDTLDRIGGDETILLVEDDDTMRVLGKTMLEKLGYHTIDASNPKEALVQAERHEGPIHLLLTDVVMPDMSGPQLYEELAKTRPETKILYMSGYTATMVARHGKLDERFPFLPKPFGLRMLADKVQLALGKRLHHSK